MAKGFTQNENQGYIVEGGEANGAKKLRKPEKDYSLSSYNSRFSLLKMNTIKLWPFLFLPFFASVCLGVVTVSSVGVEGYR